MMPNETAKLPFHIISAAAVSAINASGTPLIVLRPMFQAATRMMAATAGMNPMNSLPTAGICPQVKYAALSASINRKAGRTTPMVLASAPGTPRRR